MSRRDICCNLCGADDFRPLFPDKNSPGMIQKCVVCGLICRRHVEGEADELERWRNAELSADPSGDWIAGRARIFRPYIGMLERYKKTNRILDIGAGYGLFLNACREEGWQCDGIEISNVAADYALKNFGIKCHRVGLEDAGFGDGIFDVVTFWNVLDHLPDPSRVLKEALRVLRPAGVVVIRGPNAVFHVAGRMLSRKLGIKDMSVFHEYSFDRKTLSQMLVKSGFKDVDVRNAELAWTTRHNAHTAMLKKLACSTGYLTAELVRLSSMGKLFVSPSILAVASKPSEG